MRRLGKPIESTDTTALTGPTIGPLDSAGPVTSSQHRAPRRGKHAGGRPSKVTPAVQEKLLGLLRAGNFRSTAARAAGISPGTFDRAMADKRPRFRKFREAVERVEAQAETEIIGNIVAASREHPDVALRFAAIRWPERWGPHAVRRSEELGAVAQAPPFGTIVVPADQMPPVWRRLAEEQLGTGARPGRAQRTAGNNGGEPASPAQASREHPGAAGPAPRGDDPTAPASRSSR